MGLLKITMTKCCKAIILKSLKDDGAKERFQMGTDNLIEKDSCHDILSRVNCLFTLLLTDRI